MYPHHLRHARWLEMLACGTPIILMSSDTFLSFSRRASTIRSLVGSPRPLKNFITISSDAANDRGFCLDLTISYLLIVILKSNNVFTEVVKRSIKISEAP